MATLLLGKTDVVELMDMKSTIGAVEEVFVHWVNGKASMPAKVYLSVEKGDFRAMPAALPEASGLKWVNVHPANSRLGLPTVMGVLIYSDPETGYPLAVMDATQITCYRTGAASAVASKYLARPESKTLGLVGAGCQAHTQLEAHLEIYNFDRIDVCDIDHKRLESIIDYYSDLPIGIKNLEEVCACDIICTTTPVRKPIIRKEWLMPGVHINAVGADAPGKQELELAIINDARVVVDDPEQATKAGEINVAVSHGRYNPRMIYATLGEVIAGYKPGRCSDAEITIFDSTGIAIEDIAVARMIYNKARQQSKRYLEIDLVD